MKKIFLILATITAAVAISCSNKKEQSDRDRQRIDIGESYDTLPGADLIFADLQGAVQSCTLISTLGQWTGDSINVGNAMPYSTIVWKFDNRKFISSVEAEEYDDEEPLLSRAKIVERDTANKPLLIELAYFDSENNPLYIKKKSVTWKGQLPVMQKTGDQYTIEEEKNEFDSDNRLKHHTTLVREKAEGYKQTDTYKCIRFDEHGNWTVRWVRSLGVTVYFDDEGNECGYGDSNRFFTLQKRNITYYNP